MPTIPRTFTYEGVQFAWDLHTIKNTAALEVLDVWTHTDDGSVIDLDRNPLSPWEVYSEERLDQIIRSAVYRLLEQVSNRERR